MGLCLESVDQFYLAYDRYQRWALVNTLINFCVL